MSSATVPIAEPAGLPVRRSRVWLVLTMAVATAAYAVAGCCLVALTWDGAGGPQLRSLPIWPVLGILLSALPGQVFLTAEAVLPAQSSLAAVAIRAAGRS